MLPQIAYHITGLFRCGQRRRPSHSHSLQTAALAAEAACALAAPAVAHHPSKACSKADPYEADPRIDHLSWEEYFMAVAFLSAKRSKDPNKQVGACIVSADNVILGIGYNGFPRGCPDTKLPWAKLSRSNNALDTKYPYVCHAELNAVLNKNAATLHGARLYVTMYPCNECAKLLIQAGITEVIFAEDKISTKPATVLAAPLHAGSSALRPGEAYAAAKTLFDLAGVQVRSMQTAA